MTVQLPDPYTAPKARLDAPSDFRKRWSAAIWLAVSVALMGLAFLLVVVTQLPPLASVLCALSSLAGVVGVVRGVQWFKVAQGAAGLAAVGTVFALLGNLAMAGFGALTALLSVTGFYRGRQLRRWGRVLLPPVRAGAAWAIETPAVDVPLEARSGMAAQWRENGRTEHASVAAFARLTLDLMALGAPPALITAANRDAIDEIRHAELCFSLARALDGASTSPGPFAEPQRARTLPRTRRLALAKLAVDSLVDGALHEGVSARIIARLARTCPEPAIHAVLKELAADEGRHAAHGWDVVEWCLAEGGRSVAEALQGALRVLPRQMKSPLPAAAAGGGWEPWGIHGHALEAQEYTVARAHIERRVRAMTASM